MEFIVPQFIEKETKIIGPLSFRQLIFIGISVAICVFLWFFVLNFFVFIFLSVIILGIGASLALLKINKTSLPVYIKNYFVFIFGSKIYLWQKPAKNKKLSASPKIAKTKIPLDKKISVSLSQKSKMQNLFTEINTAK